MDLPFLSGLKRLSRLIPPFYFTNLSFYDQILGSLPVTSHKKGCCYSYFPFLLFFVKFSVRSSFDHYSRSCWDYYYPLRLSDALLHHRILKYSYHKKLILWPTQYFLSCISTSQIPFQQNLNNFNFLELSRFFR